eukprot:TRINITY_DN2301_c0_g1_i2.p2 TRINITY_DN2301_c0_g1~~TRINITY_DN2301_c0_g1_i2.p2  ORF type:complete len:116 (-),score=53.91 TRINITY_DN2301_c0_g1_i2:170-472(-)
MLRSLVGSEMCIRDRYQRRVRGTSSGAHMRWSHQEAAFERGATKLRRQMDSLLVSNASLWKLCQKTEQIEKAKWRRARLGDSGGKHRKGSKSQGRIAIVA